MRSVARDFDDLTTTARIRDAAIAYFGENGFRQTTIRQIATKAGVSAALVIHHFGSKDGLREACDAYITGLIDREVAHAATQMAPADMLAMMARRPEFVFVAPYLVTALTEGGEFADRLFARLVDDMQSYLRAAVTAGIARPSEVDERTRAEMVTLIKLGFLAFPQYVVPRDTPAESVLTLAGDRMSLAALELFTTGLYSSSDYLDAFRAQQRDRAGPDAPADPTRLGQEHPGPQDISIPTPNGGRAKQTSHPEGEHA